MQDSTIFHDVIARQAAISSEQAARLYSALWDIISREMAVGEEVQVPGLGTFYTVKYAAAEHSDTKGAHIQLPTIEPDFEPDTELIKIVDRAVAAHPDLFPDPPPEEAEEEEAGDATDTPATSEGAAAAKTPAAPPAKPERPLGRPSNIKYMDLHDVRVEKAVLALLPHNIASKYKAVPVSREGDTLTVAMIDPEDFDALQMIRKETSLNVIPYLTTQEDITLVLDQYTGLQAEVQEVLESADLGISKQELEAAEGEIVGEEVEEHAPTAKIVASLLRRAVKEKASDIHIEPYDHKLVVRFRLDGILTPRAELPKEVQAAIVARLKILARLKIDEQRLPQDGRFSMTLDGKEVDFRISTIPVVFGEKVVMRILDKEFGIRNFNDVGLMGYSLQVVEKNIKRSHGMVLVTGPTGSGKTTTLYAVLGELMSPEVNVITLEDPVEYRIESINQSQVHTEIGYTFASGLRSVVRQDPDIVMIGEIRDHETAEMAVQAALTGHVVLSTLHTNDAAGAFPRLIDMGIEPFLITSSIHTVMAQRLVRVLDQKYMVPVALTGQEMKEVVAELEKLPESTREELEKEGISLKNPVMYGPGPDAPGAGRGYKGRLGIFEMLDVTPKIQDLILDRQSGARISAEACKDGMLTLLQDGLVKALRGITSLEEVFRVTRE